MASQTPDGIPVEIERENYSNKVGGRRNPYEMRFDLLHLAKDILEQNAHMAREDKTTDPDRKTFFTTQEVIETAERLNEFVSKR
ncbi:MAG: hypothetical protein QGI09_04290 [Dehalococcoidia bacterium]|jgi:hypothetical protein|nr:hypothetical protein [Dehalococcoidia bacterium]|tara:strand:- start:110 stop:361 length:252 start_codon:yes stop_codon:yes gene_type:complete